MTGRSVCFIHGVPTSRDADLEKHPMMILCLQQTKSYLIAKTVIHGFLGWCQVTVVPKPAF